LVDHRRRPADVRLVAVEGEDVAAQEDVAADAALELAKDGVLGAGELGRHGVVERALPPRQASPQAPSRARTSSLTRLPSARPSTFAIAAPIALPMSLGPAAPDSAIGASTSSASSASPSSAGR